MSDRIILALIDDDPAVLDSTALLLRSRGFTVRPHASALEFLAEVVGKKVQVACVVSDVRMPGMTGLELQAELNRMASPIPLILITGHADVRMAVQAVKGGAADFIEKPFDIEVLIRAIETAAAMARANEVRHQQQADVIARTASLSARQRQVMSLVVEGYSSRQIAEKLGISARTVETYRLAIMEKMGAGSVAALVRMAAMLPPD